MSFELVIQQAIYKRLAEFPGIVERAAPVYDDVPQASGLGGNQNFPYIVVGDDSLVQWDTDTENGVEATVTIHTWSRYLGKKEIKELQGLIYEALHRAELVIPDYSCCVCVVERSDSFVDSDGKTRHGVQACSVLIEKL